MPFIADRLAHVKPLPTMAISSGGKQVLYNAPVATISHQPGQRGRDSAILGVSYAEMVLLCDGAPVPVP